MINGLRYFHHTTKVLLWYIYFSLSPVISDDTGLNRIDIYWLFSFISRTGIWKGTNSIRNINMLNYGIVTEDTQLNTKMDSKTTYG